MKDLLKKLGFVPEPFNISNGWGFGGGIGTSWKHEDGREVRQGKACFRHLPSQKFLTYTGPGCHRLDVKEKELIEILTK